MSGYVLNQAPIYGLPAASTEPLSDERRSELLDQVLAQKTLQGSTVVHRADHYAVISVGSKPNHVLHLLLSILTLGLWLIVWLIVAIAGGESQYAITVDEHGTVTQAKKL